jgi:hypothetical protein
MRGPLMADLYSVLGVSRSASQSEIKSAYRRLARKYHPDVNADPSAARQFARLTEAYHTLIDPQRRQLYDRLGTTARTTSQRSSSAAARAARRAYYQARADRIVNEWLKREREESRARSQAAFTIVPLFLSTFVAAMLKPAVFETSSIFWRLVLVALFLAGVWHLFTSLKRHFDHYTYRPAMLISSVMRATEPPKPFRRSAAWALLFGGYLLSLGTGMLIGMMTDDFTHQLLGSSTLLDGLFSVLFYPPIAVLIVDTMYLINIRLEEW